MKQATAISIAAVLAVVLGLGCLLHAPGTTTSKTEQNKMEYVDEKITELTTSSAYQDGTLQQRQALADELLTGLAKDGYITDLVYDELGEMYSFQYADGSLGGLMLKDFRTPPGAIPMN